jgi:hypothetical protein
MAEHVRRCYELRCNAYVNKPLGFPEHVEVIKSLSDFWFKSALVPSGNQDH